MTSEAVMDVVPGCTLLVGKVSGKGENLVKGESNRVI